MGSHHANADSPFGGSPPPGETFATTHWSIVLAAGDRALPEAAAALATLCRQYWYPLYAYVRRRTPSSHEAQDLTQEFFARVLEKNTLAAAEPERGRFRAFLLTTLKHFLADEHDRAQAQKRGGGRRAISIEQTLSLDFADGESRYRLEPADHLTPERLFERDWALALLDSVMTRLAAEFDATGKREQFEQLKPFLTGSTGPEAYAAAGSALGLSPEATRQAAHRLRRRYREQLRAAVAQTVATPDDIDDELRRLFASLSSQ